MPILSLPLLGLAGFFIAGHILLTKKKKKSLICPIVGHNCDVVVHSRFSTLFGIPNELLGLFYYGLVILASALLVSGVSLAAGVPLLSILLIAAVLALCMSVVLTVIQIFILRHYCTWCLVSAAVNVFIVITTLFAIFQSP